MSEEIRRPSDTHRMDRAAIEAALAAQHRETIPPPEVQRVIAEAQLLDVVACPCCGVGLVPRETADRVALVMGPELAEDAPITAVDDVTTQPVGPRGR